MGSEQVEFSSLSENLNRSESFLVKELTSRKGGAQDTGAGNGGYGTGRTAWGCYVNRYSISN